MVAVAASSTSPSVWTRPETTTATVGVPVAATSRSRSSWTPVRPRSVASRDSPTVEDCSRPDLPPMHTIATSASAAARTARANPERSSPVISQPGAWTTCVSLPSRAARSPATGVTMSGR